MLGETEPFTVRAETAQVEVWEVRKGPVPVRTLQANVGKTGDTSNIDSDVVDQCETSNKICSVLDG